MRRYRTVALVAAVVFSAGSVLIANVISEDGSDRARDLAGVHPFVPAPNFGEADVSLDLAATPRRTSARIGSKIDPSPSAPAGDPSTTPHGGYELAEPGDRTSAGRPDFFRQLAGSLDKPPLFASTCDFSHSRPDDPIVFPGVPGASHLHEFFGNTATDAYATDDSLRDSGKTTCSNFPGDSAAYWVPALYEDGQRVQPASITAYYTAGPKDYRTVEPFPKGLKLLVKDLDVAPWHCMGGSGAMSPQAAGPQRCGPGQHLALRIVFPDCWDGKYLNVPDHRSHMTYAANSVCPPSHPVPVPQIHLIVSYPEAQGGDVVLAPKDDPSQPHADFVNSWDQVMLSRFVRDCINSGVHCGGTPPN